jgi:hypothetical protein
MTLTERFPNTSDLVAFTEKFAHDAKLQNLFETYIFSHNYLFQNINIDYVDLDGYVTNVHKAGLALAIYINRKLDIL